MIAVQIRSKFYRGRNGWTVSWINKNYASRQRVFVHSRTAAEMIRAIVMAEDAGKINSERKDSSISACLYADEFVVGQ